MSGFSSSEFLDFSYSSTNDILHKGIFTTSNGEDFPYFIVEKNGRNFFVTPICLSGPSVFDEEKDFALLQDKLKDYNLSGGFIQTRQSIEETEELGETASANFFKDYRTNFRLHFGDDNFVLDNMHKSAKRYSKKILAEQEKYTLKLIDSQDLKSIELFANMYSNTAERLEFSDSYKFNLDLWIQLLSSKKSKLYLLYYEDQLISGTVVNPVPLGYDYTFVTHDTSFKNSGRANAIFLLKHLYSIDPSGFLDLGGGVTEGDSLSRFKKEMGCSSQLFKRLRFIFPDQYKETQDYNCLKGYWPQ